MRDLAYDDLDMDQEVWEPVRSLAAAELRDILGDMVARLAQADLITAYLAGQSDLWS